MLKIKDNVDLKKLEKYEFEEYNDTWNRHYKSNEIVTYVKKDTKEIFDVDMGYSWNTIKDLGYSKRVNDLIKDGLVEEVGE